MNYDEIKIRLEKNKVGRFVIYDILRCSMRNDSIVEYYTKKQRIKDFDEQRKINGEIKRKRKMQTGKCRIAIRKKEKKMRLNAQRRVT